MAKYFVDEIESNPRKITVQALVWRTKDGVIFENDTHPISIVLVGNKYHVLVRGVDIEVELDSLEQAITFAHNYHKTQIK